MFGMNGRSQQLAMTTITITPNTTNLSVRDSIFIAIAGLTPRRGIIKPKFSDYGSHSAALAGLLRQISHRPVAAGTAPRDVTGE